MKLFKILHFWILLREARAELNQSRTEAESEWPSGALLLKPGPSSVSQNGAGASRAKLGDTVV